MSILSSVVSSASTIVGVSMFGGALTSAAISATSGLGLMAIAPVATVIAATALAGSAISLAANLATNFAFGEKRSMSAMVEQALFTGGLMTLGSVIGMATGWYSYGVENPAFAKESGSVLNTVTEALRNFGKPVAGAAKIAPEMATHIMNATSRASLYSLAGSALGAVAAEGFKSGKSKAMSPAPA